MNSNEPALESWKEIGAYLRRDQPRFCVLRRLYGKMSAELADEGATWPLLAVLWVEHSAVD